ncbi:MAG: hypothetical protein ABSG52_09395 [Terriglobales bacterium]|jgi:hypothetical protein
MKQNRFTGAMGLRLSRQALRVLKDRGIFAYSPVSLQHQHLANRYVVRGLESGGAVGDVGRYLTFAAENGQPIEYLHPVEAIGVNGVHAVVVAPAVVRIDMLRKGRTYELLITQHGPSKVANGQRPQLETNILFRGIHGRLELDLSGKDKSQAGAVMPTFYSPAGEEISIPKRFDQAVRSITRAVNCSGCFHCHYVRAPQKEDIAPRSGFTKKQARTAGGSPTFDHAVEAPEHAASPAVPTGPDLPAEATPSAEVA